MFKVENGKMTSKTGSRGVPNMSNVFYSSLLDCDTKWWKVFLGIGYKQVVGGDKVNNEF